MAGEAEALAAFRAECGTATRGRHRSVSSTSFKKTFRKPVASTPLKTAAAAVLGTGLLLTGGVAAAATGSLPGAAQDRARDMLSHVGVSVPGSDDESAGHADQRGSVDGAGRRGEAGDEHSGNGGAVSDQAKNSDSRGVDHGAEVSGLASDGHSHTGEHGKAEAQDHPEQGKKARVDTPNKHGEDHPDNSNSDESASIATPDPTPDGLGNSDEHGQGNEHGQHGPYGSNGRESGSTAAPGAQGGGDHYSGDDQHTANDHYSADDQHTADDGWSHTSGNPPYPR
jgi:hypothetical protein